MAKRKQQVTSKETSIKLSVDFSAETAGQKEWHDVIQSDKREKLNPRIV